MHSESLRELPAMTNETSKCQQRGKFSWFIDFSCISQPYFQKSNNAVYNNFLGVVGCGEGIMYLKSLGRPADTGLQLARLGIGQFVRRQSTLEQ